MFSSGLQHAVDDDNFPSCPFIHVLLIWVNKALKSGYIVGRTSLVPSMYVQVSIPSGETS